jgi:hypothetical protein
VNNENIMKNDGAEASGARIYTNAWVKNGILYNEHINRVTLADVLEVAKKSVEILNQYKIQTAPLIEIYRNIDKATFQLTLPDYSKIILSLELIERISKAWVVDVPAEVRDLMKPLSEAFLGGHMHFADTLKQAQAEAKLYISDQTPILERAQEGQWYGLMHQNS